MSKQSNSAASLKPERASDAGTTIQVSNPIGLTELSVQTAFSSFYAGCSLPCLLVSLLLLLFEACACFGEWL